MLGTLQRPSAFSTVTTIRLRRRRVDMRWSHCGFVRYLSDSLCPCVCHDWGILGIGRGVSWSGVGARVHGWSLLRRNLQGKRPRLPALPLSIGRCESVFAAMLFPSEGICWKEHGHGVPVIVHDCEPFAFEQQARYAYRLELQLSPWNVLHVQRAADKYQVLPLVELCDAAIEKMLDGGDPNNLLCLLGAEMQICGSIGELGKRAT